MNKVWVTRTLPGADKTGKLLRDMGHEAVIAPLLKLTPPDILPPRVPDEAVLIVTSKNGLHALSKRTEKRHWSVITVGDATALEAESLGFSDVISASGTSQDIAELIKTNFSDDPRSMVHISGEHVRGHITEELTDAGFNAARHIYYRSEPVTRMPDIDIAALTHVLIFSPMAAEALRALASRLPNVTAISISREADAPLTGLEFRERLIAVKPVQNAMLTMLD